LGNHTLGLLDERQEDVFGINLVVPVALNDLSRTLRSFLGTFSETIKSHHNIVNPCSGFKLALLDSFIV
jgi:hypothetical protein